MAYVRWSRPGRPHPYDSIVYVYADVAGGITCCACTLLDDAQFIEGGRTRNGQPLPPEPVGEV